MPRVLDPQLKRALAERLRYYNELGIYDFYRREIPGADLACLCNSDLNTASATPRNQPEQRELMTARSKAATALSVVEEDGFGGAGPKPESDVADPAQALRQIREDLGEC